VKRMIQARALLGTSADPPTNGHQVLLRGLATLFPKVITWASDNPMKKHGLPLKERHHLLKVVVNEINDPRLEVIQELSSPWTIKTLDIARKLWPKDELIFVIGSDLIKDIPHWLEAKDLLKRTRLAIAIREGWPLVNNQLNSIKNLGGQIQLLPLKIPKTSSSTLRKKQEISQIPKSILPLLIQKNFYGLGRLQE